MLGEHTAVGERAHGLERVQRHTLGLRDDPVRRRLGHPVDEAVEQPVHRGVVERLEHQRRGPAPPGGPPLPPGGELGPGERQREDRARCRPVEHALDELEQPLVGPLEVLEHQRDRVIVRQTLEEQPPTREQLLAPEARLGDPEQRPQPGREELPLGRIGDPAVERERELGRGILLGCLLVDRHPLSHHLRKRPVRHAFSMRQAPPRMPQNRVRQPVDVVEELPAQTRLADARFAGDGDQSCAAALERTVKQLLDQPQVTVTADERRVEALLAL